MKIRKIFGLITAIFLVFSFSACSLLQGVEIKSSQQPDREQVQAETNQEVTDNKAGASDEEIVDDKVIADEYDYDFEDDEVLILIEKSYTQQDFTIEDFDKVDIIALVDLGESLTKRYKESGVWPDTYRRSYAITLANSGRQNVLDAIEILNEYPYVECAYPSGYDLPC